MSLVLSLILLVSVVSADPPTGCGTQFTDLDQAIDAENNFTFPTAQFNPTCVAQACPNLTSTPCPFNSGASTYNLSIVQVVQAKVKACLQAQGSICNTPVQNISLCPLGVRVQGLFDTSTLNGTLSIVPDTGFLTGIPQANFSFNETTGFCTTNVTLVYEAKIQGLVGAPGSSVALPVNNVPGTLNIHLSVTSRITPTNQFPVQLVSSIATATTQFGAFFLNPQNQNTTIIDEFQGAVNQVSSQTIQNSSLPQYFGTFIGTLLAKACFLAEQNCNRTTA